MASLPGRGGIQNYAEYWLTYIHLLILIHALFCSYGYLACMRVCVCVWHLSWAWRHSHSLWWFLRADRNVIKPFLWTGKTARLKPRELSCWSLKKDTGLQALDTIFVFWLVAFVCRTCCLPGDPVCVLSQPSSISAPLTRPFPGFVFFFLAPYPRCICLDGGKKPECVEGTQCKHRESMQTPRRKVGKGESSASWQPGEWSCPSVLRFRLRSFGISSQMADGWKSCARVVWGHLGLCCKWPDKR